MLNCFSSDQSVILTNLDSLVTGINDFWAGAPWVNAKQIQETEENMPSDQAVIIA